MAARIPGNNAPKAISSGAARSANTGHDPWMRGPCSPTALVCLLQQRKESMPSSPPTVAPSSTSLRKSGPTSERKGRPEREAANNGYNNFPFPRLHFLVSLSSAQVQVYGRERCGRRSDSSAVVNSLARESECRRARLPSSSVHVGMQKPQRRSLPSILRRALFRATPPCNERKPR